MIKVSCGWIIFDYEKPLFVQEELKLVKAIENLVD